MVQKKIDTGCSENNDQSQERVPGTRGGGTDLLGSDLGTSLEVTQVAFSRILLSKNILEAYGLNFHMVSDISSLYCLKEVIWMIHPNSSKTAPVWSGLAPWGSVYSLVCWAAELLHAKQRRDHSLQSMEKFELWRYLQDSKISVLRVYTAAGNLPW